MAATKYPEIKVRCKGNAG